MNDMKEILIKKNTKNIYNECNNVSLDDMKLLIGTEIEKTCIH